MEHLENVRRNLEAALEEAKALYAYNIIDILQLALDNLAAAREELDGDAI